MLDDFVELLRSFLAGKLSGDDFAIRYIQLSSEVVDEQWRILKSNPKLEKAANRLLWRRDFRLLNQERFEQELRKLFAPTGCRIVPYSKEDKIISHLMVEADAYRSDPEERGPYYIGEEELLAEAQNALDKLLADQR